MSTPENSFPPTLPDVKVKDNKKSIFKSQVSKYLEGVKDFPIHPPPIPVRVSRQALNRTYGITIMGLLWKSKSGAYKFLFPTNDVNPHMPRKPGQSGIIYSYRHSMCDDGPWTLFAQVKVGTLFRKEYLGDYIFVTVGSLTPEEFTNEDFKVGFIS